MEVNKMQKLVRLSALFLCLLTLLLTAACGGTKKEQTSSDGQSAASQEDSGDFPGDETSGTLTEDNSVTGTQSANSKAPAVSRTESVVTHEGGDVDAFKIKKYSPPITLTTMRFQNELKCPDPWDEGAYVKWCKETLGIIWKTKFTAVDSADALTKTILLAASNDLPDVMPDLAPVNVYNLASQGKLADMGELVEKHGSPALKYLYMDEYLKFTNNQGYNSVKYKDKIYALPQYLDIMYSTVTMNIFRKDVLDQLGFAMPKTISDLDKVFAAYKAKYPKSYCLYTNSWNITIPQIFDAYGASPYAYVLKNGKYVPGATQPEAKKALAKLKEWYSKGYINPKFSGNLNSWTGMANGEYLAVWGVPWGVSYCYRNSQQTLPNATFQVMDFLQPEPGVTSKDHYYNFTTLWPAAISANCKYKDAVINDANACVDSYFRNDQEIRDKFKCSYPPTPIQQANNAAEVKSKGPQYAKYSYPANAEGPGFFNRYNPQAVGIATVRTRAGDSMKYGPSVYKKFLENEKNLSKTMKVLSMTEANFVLTQDYIQSASPYSLKAMEGTFEFYSMLAKSWNANQIKLDESFRNTNLDSWNTLNGKFMPVITDTYNKIMMGTAPLDDFDKIQEQFDKAGGSTFTKEVNDFYKSTGILK